MENIEKLVDGKIPAYTQCPFAAACKLKKAGSCDHFGEQHIVPYSCAVARLFDIIGTREES